VKVLQPAPSLKLVLVFVLQSIPLVKLELSENNSGLDQTRILSTCKLFMLADYSVKLPLFLTKKQINEIFLRKTIEFDKFTRA
jgi:hypothetical protein